MAEPLLLLMALVVAAPFVLGPLRRPPAVGRADDDRDAALLRHRVALEALRDVEADRRAGSLDEAAYAEQLAQSEARAAETRAALGAAPKAVGPVCGARPAWGGSLVAACVIGGLLVAGTLVPATGIANSTVVNERLAQAQATEAARRERITELQLALAEDPGDPETLSQLADAYLAGSSDEDLFRAAVALQVLIELEPERAGAYERIMTAYLRAADYANARAAHVSYAELPTADPVEIAFFDGIIALRGEDDAETAVDAFDRFLELAPDDPRAAMVRGLRDEAADR